MTATMRPTIINGDVPLEVPPGWRLQTIFEKRKHQQAHILELLTLSSAKHNVSLAMIIVKSPHSPIKKVG